MSEFQGQTESGKEEPKLPIIVEKEKPPVPESRVFADKKLWNEASELATMLTYCRPHKSRTEGQFIARFLVPLGVTFDKKGNIYKKIGENPTVLWSTHTDTVHNNGGMQKIEYFPHPRTGEIFFQAAITPKTNCLGADDTAGVWLLIQMIKANIPGLYIFHRGEEVGCQGSKWIAEKNKEALAGIKYAIAFDRRGEKSIITYQMSRRCCSDEFAKSIADQLGMGHTTDTGGSTTDTRSYVDLIAECTNISVGYEGAHSALEKTNVDYLFRLRDAMLKFDASKLVEKRKPGENDSLYPTYTYHGGGSYHGYSEFWDGYDNYKDYDDDPFKSLQSSDGFTAVELNKKHKGNNWHSMYQWSRTHLRWFSNKDKPAVKTHAKDYKNYGVSKTWRPSGVDGPVNYNDLVRLIRLNPKVIAEFLATQAYRPEEIRDFIVDAGKNGENVLL